MKNFSVMVLAAVVALALAPAALAMAEGLYIAPKIGYSNFKAKTGSGDEPIQIGGGSSGSKSIVPFGLAVGYDFKPGYDVPLRAEFEYAYRGKKELIKYSDSPTGISADVDAIGKFGAQSFFLNGYFDIHNSTPVTPYIGVGLGLAKVSVEYKADVSNISGVPVDDFKLNTSKTKTNLAWNIGGGAAWKIIDNLALDLGYRYADFGKVSPDNHYIGGEARYFRFYDVKTSAHEVMLGLRFSF